MNRGGGSKIGFRFPCVLRVAGRHAVLEHCGPSLNVDWIPSLSGTVALSRVRGPLLPKLPASQLGPCANASASPDGPLPAA